MRGSPKAERRRPPAWGQWLLLAPGLLWLVGLYGWPLLGLLPLSLSRSVSRFSGTTVFSGAVDNYTEVLGTYGPILLRSFGYAAVATAVGLVLGYPLALAIRFRGGRWQSLLVGLLVLPSLSSYLVRAIAWSSLLGDRGPVLQLIGALRLVAPFGALGVLRDGRLLNSATAVVIGLTANLLPFLVVPLVVALQRIDDRLLEAAADLYATRWQRFWLVVWPLSRPGLAAGLMLSVVPAAGDVVNPQFLGGPNERMIANSIDNLMLVQLQAPQAAALTLVLMAVVIVGLLLVGRRRGVEVGLLP